MANSCKYYKQKKQFSTNSGQTWQDVTPFEYRMGSIIEPDSPDCQIEIKITRFVTMPDAFLCVGKDKYEKQVAQYSLDDGATWQYYYPSIFQNGNLIETNADICNNKWEGYYSGNTANICSAGYTYVAGRGCVKNSSSDARNCPNGGVYNRIVGQCIGGRSYGGGNTSGRYPHHFDPVKYIRCSTSTSTTLTKTDITYNPYTLYDGYIGDCVTEISAYTFSQCSALTDINIADGVTTIGEYAFYTCYSLTGVTIPNSVISIGESAFSFTPWWAAYSANTDNHYGNIIYINNLAVKAVNYNITECTFKENTISINDSAFWGCNYLTGITIPDSVTIIGQKAFQNCATITSVTIPDSVTSIGNEAFRGCYGLTSINIPSGITSIGSSVFHNCRSLTSIIIPNSVTSIGSSAFYECRSLTSVTIPNSVTSIGGSAFYNCSGLTNITIPDSLTTIGDSTFSYCRSLTGITIPDSVTSIGGNAFSYCTGLTSITIPSGVTSIGNYAFYGCSGLTSITINATTPPTIGSDVFRNTHNCPIYVPCDSVNAYKSASGWSTYASRIYGTTPCAQYRWVESGTTCIGYDKYQNNIKQVSYDYENWENVIPEEYSASTLIEINSVDCGYIPIIPKWTATYSNSHIESATCDSSSAITQNEITLTNLVGVEIGNCVTSIGNDAFYWCSSLRNATIGSGVTSIDNLAFSYCSGLTSIEIPDSVASIGNNVFQQCYGLKSVTIGSGITSIGDYAFRNCTGLTSITIEVTTPPTLGTNAFAGSNCPIMVPCDSVSTYKSASGWSSYANRIGLDCPFNEGKWFAVYTGGTTSSAACDSTSAITSGEITKAKLGMVQIGDCVTSIGNGTFWYCSALTFVNISENVTSIGDNAFRECRKLQSITIPNSVTSIGDYAFYDCSGITSVVIPSGVTSIGMSAFNRCSSLSSVTVQATTPPTLGSYAFNGTSSSLVIYVPSQSLSTYQSSWSAYRSKIQPIT